MKQMNPEMIKPVIEEPCPYCGKVEKLVRITRIIDLHIDFEGMTGELYPTTIKICNDCFMQQIWKR